jgi:hypothetical protein
MARELNRDARQDTVTSPISEEERAREILKRRVSDPEAFRRSILVSGSGRRVRSLGAGTDPGGTIKITSDGGYLFVGLK